MRPNAGNDAIRATEQAAILHLDKSTLVSVKSRDAVRHLRHTEHLQIVSYSTLVGDYPGYTGQPADGVGIASGVATHDNDGGPGIGNAPAGE